MAYDILCFVIWSGDFIFMHSSPSLGSPTGNEILILHREIMLLKRLEANSITHGQFVLHFKSESYYCNIGWSLVLLIFQFTAQLLLIPQGCLFSQLVFVVSLAV